MLWPPAWPITAGWSPGLVEARHHPARHRAQGGGPGRLAAACRAWHPAPSRIRRAESLEILTCARMSRAACSGLPGCRGVRPRRRSPTICAARCARPMRPIPTLQAARANQRATDERRAHRQSGRPALGERRCQLHRIPQEEQHQLHRAGSRVRRRHRPGRADLFGRRGQELGAGRADPGRSRAGRLARHRIGDLQPDRRRLHGRDPE